jgi:outer membrane immunogenic protein
MAGYWYAALTGRLGVTVGSVLIYGKAGGAIVDVTDSAVGACVTPGCAPLRSVAAAGGNRFGVTWVEGAGVEYAVTDRWSVKGEYLALGTNVSNTASGPGLVQRTTPSINAPQTFNWRLDIPMLQTAKIGINYKL